MFNDYCTATISLLLALLAATGTLATFTCPKPVNPIANSPSNACCKELSDLRVKLGGFSLYYGKSCMPLSPESQWTYLSSTLTWLQQATKQPSARSRVPRQRSRRIVPRTCKLVAAIRYVALRFRLRSFVGLNRGMHRLFLN